MAIIKNIIIWLIFFALLATIFVLALSSEYVPIKTLVIPVKISNNINVCNIGSTL
jgi:hypothetical protein